MKPRLHVATYVALMLLTPRPVQLAPWVQRRGQCGKHTVGMCLSQSRSSCKQVRTYALQDRGGRSMHDCTPTF